MPTKEEELKKILDDFESTGGVTGSAVVRRDGLMIISNLPGNINSKAVAAMAAAIVGTGETASNELGIGEFDRVVVESAAGKLISIGAGKDAIFTTLVKAKINIGLILMEMEKSAKRVSSVIG